jgi:hypothetical protein
MHNDHVTNLVALARSILFAPYKRRPLGAIDIQPCPRCSWIDPNSPPPERMRTNCETCCGRGYIVTQPQEVAPYGYARDGPPGPNALGRSVSR